MNPEKKDFLLTYDDVALHLFESLVDDGYAPSEDELLDLTDIVMDLIMHVHLMTGGTVDLLVSDEDGEEN